MKRRCSHCNTSNGHNARTCSTRCGGGGGLKLFGVRLTDGSSVKKSASMGNLSHYSTAADYAEGYHSDYLNHSLAAGGGPIRKKGIPWTEEEHRQFLLGLHKLGRGNWRGISRNYVPSRTPTQVASHAQKYFIRQSNATGKKKRPSLFDLAPDMETNSLMPVQSTTTVSTDDEKLMLRSSQEVDIKNSLHSLDLSLKLAFTPFPFQLLPPNAYSRKGDESQTSQHHIVRPVQVHQEETMKMSQLTLGETSAVQIDSWLELMILNNTVSVQGDSSKSK